MKILCKSVLCMWGALFAAVPLAAQQESKADMKEQILLVQARNADRSHKVELLKEIESGNVAIDAAAVKALAVLAGDGTIYRDAIAASKQDSLDIRSRALTLLGKAGGDDARSAVMRSLSFENDPMAMSAGFTALAALGGGSDMSAVREMNNAMRRNMVAADVSDSAADDYLTAIAQLVTSGSSDADTIDVVTRLSEGQSGYNPTIRRRALEYLKSFWQ